ncbi:hypothetical protein AYO21_07372 [Fonsecaea monophora]|uniref:Uncharacterized protein n=1 Tax=Fonsecaea monophora TaxID=254056 RepID=A0A177F531_9EURO|nr:hypothetical protein AYO21_07372 [Fonsecaea monophora]OAG38389.1 hypothetical protein AYO21_07372 [Fonsecaea monophora]
MKKLPVFGRFPGPEESHDSYWNVIRKEDASRTASSCPKSSPSPASNIPSLVVLVSVSDEENARASPIGSERSDTLAATGLHGPHATKSPASGWTDEQSTAKTTEYGIREDEEEGEEKVHEDLVPSVAGCPVRATARSVLPTFSSPERLERRVFVPWVRYAGPHERVVPRQRTTWLDRAVDSDISTISVPLNTSREFQWTSQHAHSRCKFFFPREAGVVVAGPPRSSSLKYTRRRFRRARLTRSCSSALPSRVHPLVDSSHVRYHSQATPARTVVAAAVSPDTRLQDSHQAIHDPATIAVNNNSTTTPPKMPSYTMTCSPMSPCLLTLSPVVRMPAAPPPTPAQGIQKRLSRSQVDEADMNIDDILSALPIGIPIPSAKGKERCLSPVETIPPTPPSSPFYGRRSRSSSTSSSSATSSEDEDRGGGVWLRRDPFVSIVYPGRGEASQPRPAEPDNKLLAALVEDSMPHDSVDDAALADKEPDFDDEDLVTVALDDLTSYRQTAKLCRKHRVHMPCERGKRARDVDHGPLRQRRVTRQIDLQQGAWVDIEARGLSSQYNQFGAVGQRVTARAVPPPVPTVQNHEKVVWRSRGWTVVPHSGPATALLKVKAQPWFPEDQYGC